MESIRALTRATAAASWLAIELLNHGQTQSIQRIRRFVVFPTLIVAQKRKNDPPPIRRLRKTGTRPYMLDRTGLRMNAPRARRILHQCFQRPVDSSNRQRRVVRRKPGLALRILQQRDDRPWRDQIVPRKP